MKTPQRPPWCSKDICTCALYAHAHGSDITDLALDAQVLLFIPVNGVAQPVDVSAAVFGRSKHQEPQEHPPAPEKSAERSGLIGKLRDLVAPEPCAHKTVFA